MPALKPCLTRGRLQHDGARCRRCARKRRGTGESQTAYRRAVLAEHGETCARCGRDDVEVEAHHLLPLGDGGGRGGPGVPLASPGLDGSADSEGHTTADNTQLADEVVSRRSAILGRL